MDSRDLFCASPEFMLKYLRETIQKHPHKLQGILQQPQQMSYICSKRSNPQVHLLELRTEDQQRCFEARASSQQPGSTLSISSYPAKLALWQSFV